MLKKNLFDLRKNYQKLFMCSTHFNKKSKPKSTTFLIPATNKPNRKKKLCVLNKPIEMSSREKYHCKMNAIKFMFSTF